MSKVALAWELGAGSGHVSKLLALGKGLQARGHEVFALLRDLSGSAVLDSIPALQAPVWVKETRGFAEPPLNYSEILLRFGYHDAGSLQELVSAWCHALKGWGPVDVLIADHAPTALLAARILGIPSVAIGDGFVVPPLGIPMPNMRPWVNIPDERLANSDGMVLQNINAVLGQYGCPSLVSVSALLDVEQRLIFSLSELDHYHGRVGEAFLGPVYEEDCGLRVAWPEKAGKKIFVYLRPQHREFARLVELLAALGVSAVVCAPGIPEQQRQALTYDAIVIHADKVSFASIAGADLAITYGSSATAAAMLLAGIPMLMLPTHLEQFLISQRVQALGAGIAINPDIPSTPLVPALRLLLDQSDYRKNAERAAAKYANYNQSAMLHAAVDGIERLCKRGN